MFISKKEYHKTLKRIQDLETERNCLETINKANAETIVRLSSRLDESSEMLEKMNDRMKKLLILLPDSIKENINLKEIED